MQRGTNTPPQRALLLGKEPSPGTRCSPVLLVRVDVTLTRNRKLGLCTGLRGCPAVGLRLVRLTSQQGPRTPLHCHLISQYFYFLSTPGRGGGSVQSCSHRGQWQLRARARKGREGSGGRGGAWWPDWEGSERPAGRGPAGRRREPEATAPLPTSPKRRLALKVHQCVSCVCGMCLERAGARVLRGRCVFVYLGAWHVGAWHVGAQCLQCGRVQVFKKKTAWHVVCGACRKAWWADLCLCR